MARQHSVTTKTPPRDCPRCCAVPHHTIKQEDDVSPEVAEMETSPLLKNNRPCGESGFIDEHGAIRTGAPPFAKSAVFAVFFFPALGGLLFG